MKLKEIIKHMVHAYRGESALLIYTDQQGYVTNIVIEDAFGRHPYACSTFKELRVHLGMDVDGESEK